MVTNGANQWRALVEAKIGGEILREEQIERYRNIAKEHGVDCVITISNQFATNPSQHPLSAVAKSRSKIPVFHWSWMYMLTTADLLLSNQQVEDADQQILLYELCRFLTHDSAGVKGFDRMPKEWGELNKLVSAGGKIPKKSDDAEIVLRAWHQETKDLSLILSRQTETTVSEKLSRAHMNSAAGRLKDELAILIDTNCLSISLNVPDAAAPIQILADMGRRTVEVGMTIRAPEDKKSSKARLNWLLRQLKSEETDDIFIRLNWPGRSESTQFALSELRDDPSICEEDKGSLQVLSFHLFTAKRLGAKFTQQMNFISELEALVPLFYREFGQDLVEWRKAAPKIEKIAKPVSDIDLEDIQEIIEK